LFAISNQPPIFRCGREEARISQAMEDCQEGQIFEVRAVLFCIGSPSSSRHLLDRQPAQQELLDFVIECPQPHEQACNSEVEQKLWAELIQVRRSFTDLDKRLP
jgi:hypothetical protein